MEVRLRESARNWTDSKRDEEDRARERAALQLASGVDLGAALAATGARRERLLMRLRRLLERERLKASRPASAYSLDRHIALKRTLDRLTGRVARPVSLTPRRRRNPS
jgi:hypothetical protein